MKKYKTFKYATILITEDKKVEKIGKHTTTFRLTELPYCVDIKYPTGARTLFCDKTLKNLYKRIGKALYI